MDRAHLDFALAVHDRLPPNGNLVWSPYSVAAALGLAAAGAQGPTRDELANVLAPGNGDLAALTRMLAGAAQLHDAEIAVANRLWMRQGVRFTDTYQQTVLDLPGGALHTANFGGDPEGARAAINSDVEKTTQGLIRELLAPGTISAATAAVLVNALYLKLGWLTAFESAATAPRRFAAPSGPREVPTMHQQERLRYAESDGWRMATLSTMSDVLVDVLLPPPGAEQESPALSTDTAVALRAASTPVTVNLSLPRFRLTAQAELDHVLHELGVLTAYTDDADFSPITDSRLRIDTVVHKAVLRVDEQGFEGAAATAVVMRLTSLTMADPVPFHVDRPFLVIVRHAGTGAIYFLARITDPE